MRFFTSKPNTERLSLILLFKSGSVEAGITLAQGKEKPSLIYSVERSFVSNGTAGEITARLGSALEAVCERVSKEGLPHIFIGGATTRSFHAIRFVYASPWYDAKGKRIVLETERPTVYTDETLRELTEAEGSGGSNDTITVERFSSSWEIDGYRTTDAVGKKGTRLSVDLFTSRVSARLKENLEERVLRWFRAKEETHHSIALYAHQTFFGNGRRSGLEHILFVHLSSSITEMVLMSDSALLDAITYPTGSSHIKSAQASATGRLEHEFEKEDIGELSQEWFDTFGVSLRELYTRARPERIVFVSDAPASTAALRAIEARAKQETGEDVKLTPLGDALVGRVFTKAHASSASPVLRMLALYETADTW